MIHGKGLYEYKGAFSSFLSNVFYFAGEELDHGRKLIIHYRTGPKEIHNDSDIFYNSHLIEDSEKYTNDLEKRAKHFIKLAKDVKKLKERYERNVRAQTQPKCTESIL